MKRTTSMRSQSRWGKSHISPKNSKWLAEKLEEADRDKKRILKLIGVEGDSFSKKAEMWYINQPELKPKIEELFGKYCALAARYDRVTRRLSKGIGHRSSSSPDHDTESDYSSESTLENGNHFDQLQETIKISNLEDALVKSNEKSRVLEDEIARLKLELDQNQSTWKESHSRFVLLEAELNQLKGANSEKESQIERLLSTECRLKDKRMEEVINKLEYYYDAHKLRYDTLEAEKNELFAKMQSLETVGISRDDRMWQMEEHSHRLHMEYMQLIKRCSCTEDAKAAAAELSGRVQELEEEVERQRVVIADNAELKREAIRQLCISLEHYRERQSAVIAGGRGATRQSYMYVTGALQGWLREAQTGFALARAHVGRRLHVSAGHLSVRGIKTIMRRMCLQYCPPP